MACRNSHKQARPRAGIAEIDDVLRLRKSADADAVDAPDAVAFARNIGAEHAHGRSCAQHVVAFEQALDARSTDGERAQDECAMRQGLVAGYAQSPAQCSGCSRWKRRHARSMLKGRSL